MSWLAPDARKILVLGVVGTVSLLTIHGLTLAGVAMINTGLFILQVLGTILLVAALAISIVLMAVCCTAIYYACVDWWKSWKEPDDGST